MLTQNQHDNIKKSRLFRNTFFLIVALVVAAIALIALNYHLQNPALIIGGGIAVILVHLAIAGGLAHILPQLKKRFYTEPVE